MSGCHPNQLFRQNKFCTRSTGGVSVSEPTSPRHNNRQGRSIDQMTTVTLGCWVVPPTLLTVDCKSYRTNVGGKETPARGTVGVMDVRPSLPTLGVLAS